MLGVITEYLEIGLCSLLFQWSSVKSKLCTRDERYDLLFQLFY